MTPTQYATLRKSIASQRKIAPLLGIHWRTVQCIEVGDYGDPVPRKYELGLRGLIAENAMS